MNKQKIKAVPETGRGEMEALFEQFTVSDIQALRVLLTRPGALTNLLELVETETDARTQWECLFEKTGE